MAEILGNWTIYPSNRGYDEVFFDEEQDISEKSIDLLNGKIVREFGVTEDQIDWRDPQTLWIWDIDFD